MIVILGRALMKLLFDQMLSPTLVDSLADEYPNSTHTHAVGMGEAEDRIVRRWAGERGYVIVTKDADHEDLVLRFGFPPKVIKVNTGNCSTRLVEQLLREHRVALLAFEGDEGQGIFYVDVA